MNQQQEQRIYLNGFFVREKEFGNGRSVMNVAVKIQDFIDFANQHGTDGFVKIVIEKRREPSDKGLTHSARLDTWKPSGQPRQQQSQQPKPAQQKPFPIKKEQPKLHLDSDEDGSSVPF
jgi:hypothetical protein